MTPRSTEPVGVIVVVTDAVVDVETVEAGDAPVVELVVSDGVLGAVVARST